MSWAQIATVGNSIAEIKDAVADFRTTSTSLTSTTMSVPRLLVVGGNGYLGSAVCKAAVAKGWDVASMSWVSPLLQLPTLPPSCRVDDLN